MFYSIMDFSPIVTCLVIPYKYDSLMGSVDSFLCKDFVDVMTHAIIFAFVGWPYDEWVMDIWIYSLCHIAWGIVTI